MQKMKEKVCNGSLGLLPMVALVSFLKVMCFGGEMGVQMASSLPLFKFPHQSRSPRRAGHSPR